MTITFNYTYEDMSLAITDMNYSEEMPRDMFEKLYVASGEDVDLTYLEMT